MIKLSVYINSVIVFDSAVICGRLDQVLLICESELSEIVRGSVLGYLRLGKVQLY